MCPVTDCTLDRPSYTENGTGYFLTTSLMEWFWEQYCPAAERIDPRASPIRGRLDGLPPALVVTSEFDPLRDEGIAYGEALAKAGVPVEQLEAQGHFHSSFVMVDVMLTGVPRGARRWRALSAASPASPSARSKRSRAGRRPKLAPRRAKMTERDPRSITRVALRTTFAAGDEGGAPSSAQRSLEGGASPTRPVLNLGAHSRSVI